MSRLKKIIELKEFDQHNKPDDCWIVIDGKIIDVTTFTDLHPGGGDVLAEHAGKDATQAFNSIGHSEGAKMQVMDYLVGILSAEDLAIVQARE